MPISSRDKGQNGERELADVLNTLIFGVTGVCGDFKRNLQQTQAGGGFDLWSVAYPYFAIEIKRVEAISPKVIDGFWAQALRQATQYSVVNPTQNLLPILCYRQNRRPWRVRTYGNMIYSTTRVVVDVSLEDFASWFAGHVATIDGKAKITVDKPTLLV
jgi:hypothetical protein